MCMQKRVEEEKADLVQKFGELAEKAERRKMLAENRIEEEMKVRITSLESRLRELADLKSKTGLKIAACFELVNLKNDDPRIFLMKFKNLQQEFGARTGNYIEQKVLTDCASSILFDRLKSDIISNAMKDFCPSVRRRQIPG
ncbi:hypothetical protein CHS0354_040502 [Potamilus streckersoni]|uniref:Uncharacterized protein n=1 Tax=Potamilus streckersoni TaxID=2493646 RepID=A0AAE0TL04_9BIVA|nr:hypothetical protein CHS0354_040502 [Potamilus streckersoni]